MDQDFKNESSQLISGRKIAGVLVIIAVLAFLYFFGAAPGSRALVLAGNIGYSNGSQWLGTTSYTLAVELNHDLREATSECAVALAQRKYETALDSCDRAIKINDDFAYAYFDRGLVYQNMQQYEQAIADYTRAIELIPTMPVFHTSRADVYMLQEAYEPAVADYTQAIALDPNDRLAFINRAKAYSLQGQPTPAIADLTAVIEMDPGLVPAYLERGKAYAARRDYILAIQDFTRVLELDPHEGQAYMWRGNAHADLQQFDLAIADYQKALSALGDPITKSYTYCVQGLTYTKMGDYEAAIESLVQGVKANDSPENDWCRSALEEAQQHNE